MRRSWARAMVMGCAGAIGAHGLAAGQTAPATAPPQGAAGAWRAIGDVAAAQPEASALTLLAVLAAAAAIGGFIGARLRRIGARAVEGQSRPARPAASQPPAGRDGLIFRDEGGGAAAPEAARLFAYFDERFGLRERRADSVIAYLNDVAASIGRLRARAESAEERAEALDDALRRAATGAGPDGFDSAPSAAAWRMALDGARLARSAVQSLRRDPDFTAFAAAVGLEATLRQIAAARVGLPDRDPRVAPTLVEDAWPHDLWRAEALLSAYFPGHDAWADLREGVSAASAGVRALLRLEGVVVAQAALLSDYAPAAGERWSAQAAEIAEITPVRRRVVARAQAGGDFVVDCESFGYLLESRGARTRSRLILYAPDAWR